MDRNQVIDLILAGNSAAMDWFALTHDQPLPSQSATERLFGVDLGPVSPQIGLAARGITTSQMLLVAAIGVGLFLLIRR